MDRVGTSVRDLGQLRSLLTPDACLRELVIATRPQWRGRIFSVDVMDVGLPDGGTGVREVVRHHGGAGVCAVRDGAICLVRQWRVALGAMTLEIPAGKLEAGEDPAACAARELEEEAGLVAERLEPIACSVGSPGFSDEATRIFGAVGLGRSDAHPDEGEFVDVVWVGLDVALDAIRCGVITDAKTIIAVQHAALLRLPAARGR